MDDWLCLGALHAIGINVGHHIVPHQPFTLLGNFVVDVILMCFQLGDLLICDLQAELLLTFSERNPEPPPSAEFEIRGEDILQYNR